VTEAFVAEKEFFTKARPVARAGSLANFEPGLPFCSKTIPSGELF
jgi:hypothetical protein